jgi:hypothetical protein
MTELGSRTNIVLYTSDQASVLQTAEFQTSCREPLSLGDRFGSLRIVGYRAALANPTNNLDTPQGPTTTR